MPSSPAPSIVNAGPLEWAFRDFAQTMSRVLWVDVVEEPTDHYFLLAWDGPHPSGSSFVPYDAIQTAGDKRLIAAAFARHDVPTPETQLLATWAEVSAWVDTRSDSDWVLKYPTASGGSGHRLITPSTPEPRDWPTPFVVQRFVSMARPEVFRIYGVAGETFGFNARRFPSGVEPSPWVAHARGARYEHAGVPPEGAVAAARAAMQACDLLDSFGCADLVFDGDRWLALEVGTDGACGHVDRDVDDAALRAELDGRTATAFWRWVGEIPPWGRGPWRIRN